MRDRKVSYGPHQLVHAMLVVLDIRGVALAWKDNKRLERSDSALKQSRGHTIIVAEPDRELCRKTTSNVEGWYLNIAGGSVMVNITVQNEEEGVIGLFYWHRFRMLHLAQRMHANTR